MNSIASVTVLSRLSNPNIGVFTFLLQSSFLKLFLECLIFLTDVESEWHNVKKLLVCQLAVVAEIEEQGFFIAQVTISWHMIVYQ